MNNKSNEWNSINHFAKGVIKKHQVSYPVKLGSIAKEFGLIVKSSTLPGNISGEIKEYPDKKIIIKVNRHDVKARQRYTLAHEIAHFLLHRDLLGNGITDDVLYRSQVSNVIEQEANRLAADIIMPIDVVNSLYDKYKLIRKDDGIYEGIADELGVSPTAVKYRLGK